MTGRSLLLLLFLVPAVAASDLGAEGTVDDTHDQAAAAWADAQREVHAARDTVVATTGSTGRPDDEPQSGPGGSEGTSPATVYGHAKERTAPTVTFVAKTTEDVLATDPLDVLEQTVIQPAQAAAGGITAEVERVLAPPTEDEPTAPEPQPTASVAEPTGLTTPMIVAAASVAAAGTVLVVWLAGGSSSVGAAGAAKGAADLRRLLPYASPLFTRFEKDTVLGHPKREHLYALVLQHPGVTLQDLCDKTNLSRTAVTHHLRLMEQNHVIVSKRVGRSRHFYENGGRYGRDQKEALAVLQNERSLEVARFIETHPGAIQKHICQAIGIQASVAHWHVRRLQEANLVEAVRQGRTVSYFASQPLPA